MAFGITSIFKKKVEEEKVADLFVNIVFNAVDTSFGEVAELLNNDLNLIARATVDPENQDDFLMIVLAGNFHLLDEYFHEGQEERALQVNHDTTLTAWFQLNQRDPDARQYLYHDIPDHYTYDTRAKKWKVRQRPTNIIGRIYQVQPSTPERFVCA